MAMPARTARAFCMAALTALVLTAIPAGAADVLSLDECITTALANNPALRELRYAADTTGVQVKSATYTLFPQLSAGINYTNLDGHDYRTNTTIDGDGYDASLSLTQTVFASGRNVASLKKARATLASARAACARQEDLLTASIKKRYYQVVENMILLAAREDDLARKKDNAALVGLLYKIGNETKPNLDQTTYNVARAAYNLRSTQSALTISLQTLALEMGLATGTAFTVNPATYTPAVTLTREECLARARANRKDLAQKQLSLEANALERTIARSERLPAVSLSAGYTWAGATFFPDDADIRTRLSVTFPLSAGFPVYAALKENTIARASLTVDKKALEDSIALEVTAAHEAVALAQERLALADTNIAVARDRSTLARMEYNQGGLSFIEFENIEDNLSAAEQERAAARFASESAKADLLAAIGER